MTDGPTDVPPPEPEKVAEPVGNGGSHLEQLEFRRLDAEAKAREQLNREADQRYYLRLVAVIMVCLAIMGMAWTLWHVAHRLPAGNAAASVIIVLHLAPIASITLLNVALLVAAFRGFNESDGTSAGKVVSEGLKTGVLLPSG